MTGAHSLLCWFFVSLLCLIIGIVSEDVVVAVSTFDDQDQDQYVTEQDSPYQEYTTYPQYNFRKRPPNSQVHYVTPMHPQQMRYKPVQMYRPNPNIAEERKIKYVKLLKKKKKKKYKKLKKYLKNCGYPHHFKFKKTKYDDDEGNEYDTVKIGIMNDDFYHQRAMRRNDSGNVTIKDEKDEDDDDEEEEEVVIEEDDDEDDNRKEESIKPFTNIQRPYFSNPLMMQHPFPRPMFPGQGPPPGHPMYHLRFPPPKPLPHMGPGPVMGPGPLMRPPFLHPPGIYPGGHPPSMFGPPRVFPRPRPWMKPLHLNSPPKDLLLRETYSFENTSHKTDNPVITIKSVERIKVDNRHKLNDTKAFNTFKRVSSVTPQKASTTVNHYEKISNYNSDFSPSHTAFSNPNTYNVQYSQPDYSMFGSYSELTDRPTTDKPSTPAEKVVTVTPSSIWEGQPIFAAETTTVTKPSVQIKNITRKIHVRRLDEQENKWVPLDVIPTKKISSKFKRRENYVTYPSVDHQQVKSPLSRLQNPPSSSNIETQHENSKSDDSVDIITAKYPLDDINNMRLDMNRPSNRSKPFIITKDNMNKYGFNKSMVFFNVADRIINKTGTDYNKEKLRGIPKNNSRIRRSGIKNVSQYVTGSLRVRVNSDKFQR